LKTREVIQRRFRERVSAPPYFSSMDSSMDGDYLLIH
jgi:hypothetical protein